MKKVKKGIFTVRHHNHDGLYFLRIGVAAIVDHNGFDRVATLGIEVQLDSDGKGFTAYIEQTRHFDNFYGSPEDNILADEILGKFQKWRERYEKQCAKLGAKPSDDYAHLIPYYLKNKWKLVEVEDWETAYEKLTKEV